MPFRRRVLQNNKTLKKDKLIKKKLKTRNFRAKMHVGGEISLNDFEANLLGYYYCYAELCRDYLIRNVNFNGVSCRSNIRSLDLLFKGANGFALKFICENGSTYTIKLIFNTEQMYGNVQTFATFERTALPKICNEFTSINNFNSDYIMKAHKYFLYDGTQFILSSQCGVPRRTDIERIESDRNKKIVTVEAEAVTPMFSGLLLEYVQQGLEKILTNAAILNKKNIITLFLHYLRALDTISENNYIHKDIKLDNLMFNITPGNSVIGKVIDFGETYLLKTVNDAVGFKDFEPSTLESSPMSSDVPALRRISASQIATRSTTAEQSLIIDEIRVKYDLYSLSKTFKEKLIPRIDGIDFSDFIENVLVPGSKEDYTERINIETAIAITLSLL